MAKLELNWVTVLLIVGVIWIAMGGSFAAKSPQQSTTVPPYIATGATTLTYVTTDALQTGTSVGVTTYTRVNGAAFKTGVTSASPADVLDVLFLNNTGYHNAYVSGIKVEAKPAQVLSTTLKGNGTLTISVFNEDGQKMTSGAASANNQTMSSGSTGNMQFKLTGTDKKATNDIVCVFEANSTSVDSIVLSGTGVAVSPKGLNAKPGFYTTTIANPQTWVYELPEVSGAEVKAFGLTVKSKTSQDTSGQPFYINCYTKEHAIDGLSGAIIYDIEDSLSTAKYINSATFTGYFQ